MNKKEVTEIKKQFTPHNCAITRICGCYVDGEKEKKTELKEAFLSLPEEEMFKYFDIFRKSLSGTIGKNLLNMEFPLETESEGGTQEFLLKLRNSRLTDDDLLTEFYNRVIDSYDFPENYLILLIHAVYDIPGKASDGTEMFDASDEVFDYILCCFCPVKLSKPALSYHADENSFHERIRDWIVEMPDAGFLFPAFNVRSTDIHSTLFYTKNTKEPHSEFMANGLGCGIERTATEQKMAFHSIVRNVLGAEDEHTDEVLLDMQQNLSDMIDEYAETHDSDEDVFMLDKEVVTKLLADSEISEEKASRIEKSVDEAFGEKPPVAEHVIDTKALAQNELRVEKLALEDQVGNLTVQLTQKDDELKERTSQLIEKQEEIDNYIAETKTYDVVLRVKPEKASQIKSQMIDGQKCLVIPMRDDEHATINGVNTTV